MSDNPNSHTSKKSRDKTSSNSRFRTAANNESRSPSTGADTPIGLFKSTHQPKPVGEPFDHFIDSPDIDRPIAVSVEPKDVKTPLVTDQQFSFPPTLTSFEQAIERMDQGVSELNNLRVFIKDISESVRGIAKSVNTISESTGIVRDGSLILKRSFAGDPIMLPLDSILTESIFLNRVFDLLADDIDKNIAKKVTKAAQSYSNESERLKDTYKNATSIFMAKTEDLHKVARNYFEAQSHHQDILTRYRLRYPSAMEMPQSRVDKLAEAEKRAIRARTKRLSYTHEVVIPAFEDFSAVVFDCWGDFAELERGRYATQRNMVIRLTRVFLNRSVALQESIENLRVVASNPVLKPDRAVNAYLKQIMEPEENSISIRVSEARELCTWAERIVQFGEQPIRYPETVEEENVDEAEREEGEHAEEEEEVISKPEPIPVSTLETTDLLLSPQLGAAESA